MSGATAHDSDVADTGSERTLHRRDIKFWIVGKNADRISRPEGLATLIEYRTWPGHPNLVSHWKATARRKDFPSITDKNSVAENLCHPSKRSSEIHSPKYPHLGWWRPALDEHPDGGGSLKIFRGGLPLRAVGADTRSAGLEFGKAVSMHDSIKVRMTKGAVGGFIRNDEEVVAYAFAFNHRCKSNRITRSHAF